MPRAEKALIARIRKLAGKPGRGIIHGIGDDCAILRPRKNEDLVVTTDLLLEGTHFRQDWHPADAVGHKCLARGLSDIAAMGAEPVAAFLSLGLPAKLPQKWIDDFLRGFLRLAKRYNVALAGGDIAESRSGILADIMLIGSVPLGRAITRSGARPGDIIYVTGALGGSAATLERLCAKEKVSARSLANTRHFYPEPRVEIGQYLRDRRLATAMIDVSDGLSTDLEHICEESLVGARLMDEALPISRDSDVLRALHGGEEYELVFTARRSTKIPSRIATVPITEIGWITKNWGSKKHPILMINLTRDGKVLKPQGWEHFRKK